MLQTKVNATIEKYRMFKPGETVLVGVSGGADSMALFHILFSMRKSKQLRLCVAHLNHKLRGGESDEDAEFVKELAFKLKVPFYVKEANIKEAAANDKRSSMEEIARTVRYEFFKEVAGSCGAKRIAVAHTADDQAETVLMRMLRGAGLSGLSGIPPVRQIGSLENGISKISPNPSLRKRGVPFSLENREFPGKERYFPLWKRGIEGDLSSRRANLYIVRPLIACWRRDIEDYLKKKKLFFRTDSSNLAPVYFRNKIRLELLPMLEKEYKTNIKQVLVNMAENMRVDFEYIEGAAKRKFNSLKERGADGETELSLKKISTLHKALQQGVIRHAICRTQGSLRRITYEHWLQIEELIFNRPTNSIVHLPKGIKVCKKDKVLQFSGDVV